METRYKILFSVELKHDYYNQDQTFDDLEIVPAEKTKSILKGCRILYKVNNNNLVALVEVDENDKPFIKINTEIPLRFILKSKNPSFKNISALKLFGAAGLIYYFTNKFDNEKNGTLYLSKPIPVHSASEDYEVGSLIQDATDIYEAVVNNTASPPPDNSWRKLSPQRYPLYILGNHSDINKGTIVFDAASSSNYEALKFIPQGQSIPVTDTNYWKESTALQYVSSEDLININFISVSSYDIDNHADIMIGAVLLNDSDSKLYKALKFIARGNPVPVSDNDYWEVLSDLRFVRSNDVLSKGDSIFGVVDLFFDSSVASNYSMLDTADKVREVKYVIRFKNRITTWKYISQKNTVTSLSDASGTFNFLKTNNEFVSDFPIPLMSKPFHNFLLNSIVGTQTITVDNLQCASSGIKPNETTKSFLSEIFLNY